MNGNIKSHIVNAERDLTDSSSDIIFEDKLISKSGKQLVDAPIL